MDPSGQKNFSLLRLPRAFLGWVGYQLLREQRIPSPEKTEYEKALEEQEPGESTPFSRVRRDMQLNARIAGSDQTARDLRKTSVDTAVDIAEYGLYSRMLDSHTVAADLNTSGNPHLKASVRRDAKHSWYDLPTRYALAVTEDCSS